MFFGRKFGLVFVFVFFKQFWLKHPTAQYKTVWRLFVRKLTWILILLWKKNMLSLILVNILLFQLVRICDEKKTVSEMKNRFYLHKIDFVFICMCCGYIFFPIAECFVKLELYSKSIETSIQFELHSNGCTKLSCHLNSSII